MTDETEWTTVAGYKLDPRMSEVIHMLDRLIPVLSQMNADGALTGAQEAQLARAQEWLAKEKDLRAKHLRLLQQGARVIDMKLVPFNEFVLTHQLDQFEVMLVYQNGAILEKFDLPLRGMEVSAEGKVTLYSDYYPVELRGVPIMAAEQPEPT